LFSASLSLSAQSLRYDLAFKHWGEYYFAGHDWRWWKAQGIAESGLNQAARGSAGEIGIMQLMPATARELGVDPFDAESNIQGGIQYDAALYRAWAAARDVGERRDLTFGSYNAGLGNVQKAAALAGAVSWSAAAELLERVTGRLAAGTIGYVRGIRRTYLGMR